jgi:hypothetical protein
LGVDGGGYRYLMRGVAEVGDTMSEQVWKPGKYYVCKLIEWMKP